MKGALPKTQSMDFELVCSVCKSPGNPSKINFISKGEIMGFSSSMAVSCPRRFYHFPWVTDQAVREANEMVR